MTRSMSRVTAGIVVGGLMAAGAAIAQRQIQRRAGAQLLDWEVIRHLARRRLGRQAVPLSPLERGTAEAAYARILEGVTPLVASEVGARLASPLAAPLAIDRLGWIDINLATFRHLFARIEHELQAGATSAGTGAALARILNRSLGNQQLGFLLAFLARKVLGQYDVSLLATHAPAQGRLYVVEHNVRATAHSLGVPLDEFRTFIILHEATHAFEFEAHPWLRQHFAAEVDTTLAALATESGNLWSRVANALGSGEGHWLERFLTPNQRAAFQRTQALMALLEGYSNHVMHAVGARILPRFDVIHERFEARHNQRGTLERAVMRMTGLDLKLEQYTAGERFVSQVLAQRGRDVLRRVWAGPAWLPSLSEIHAPDDWLARTDALAEASGGPTG